MKGSEIVIKMASVADAKEILELQKLAFTGVGDMYNNYTIPPLVQTLEEIRAQFSSLVFLKAIVDGKIIGSVRGYAKDGTCYIGRLIVNPVFENRGIGSRLMQAIETEFGDVKRYELFTGHRSERNIYLYKKLGYTVFKNVVIDEGLSEVFMEKVIVMNKTPVKVEIASVKDAEEILDLQKLAYITEAEIYNDYTIPPLTQTLPEMLDDFRNYTVLKATADGVIIGSVRGQLTEDTVYVGRLMVDPEYQNKGLGARLMLAIESAFPQAKKFTLGTGHRSERNLYLYHKIGYKIANAEVVNENLTMIHLEKIIR